MSVPIKSMKIVLTFKGNYEVGLIFVFLYCKNNGTLEINSYILSYRLH
ncbi:hypothetical protein C21_03388 [Arenibacter sp. NBRC 103722]|nr:hypothetical protein C21_03388 [Arenibacter sp. NBRC 103722]